MFDVLTYTKGGAVLRMIEQWLGPDTFRDGIRRYLATHAYGNTETHDLWDALAARERPPDPPDHGALDLPAGLSRHLGHARRRHRAARRSSGSRRHSRTTDPPGPFRSSSARSARRRRRAAGPGRGGRPGPPAGAPGRDRRGQRGFDGLRAHVLRRRPACPADTRSVQDLSPAERQSLVDDAWAAVVAGRAGVGSFLDLAAGFRERSVACRLAHADRRARLDRSVPRRRAARALPRGRPLPGRDRPCAARVGRPARRTRATTASCAAT